MSSLIVLVCLNGVYMNYYDIVASLGITNFRVVGNLLVVNEDLELNSEMNLDFLRSKPFMVVNGALKTFDMFEGIKSADSIEVLISDARSRDFTTNFISTRKLSVGIVNGGYNLISIPTLKNIDFSTFGGIYGKLGVFDSSVVVLSCTVVSDLNLHNVGRISIEDCEVKGVISGANAVDLQLVGGVLDIKECYQVFLSSCYKHTSKVKVSCDVFTIPDGYSLSLIHLDVTCRKLVLRTNSSDHLKPSLHHIKCESLMERNGTLYSGDSIAKDFCFNSTDRDRLSKVLQYSKYRS